MTAFFYFVGQLTSDQVKLAELPGHLPGIFADCEQPLRDVHAVDVPGKGPSHEPGVILYAPGVSGEMPDRLGYYPGERSQRWLATADPRVWIGWDVLQPPGPEDLQRKRVHVGYDVTDSHRRIWKIPVARSPDDNRVTLPSNYLMGGDGKVTKQLKSEFDWLWQVAGEIWNWFNTPDSPADHDRLWLAAQAADILGVNYRAAWPEINALAAMDTAVLDDDTTMAIVTSVIDVDILREAAAVAEKKSEPEAPPISD